MASKMIQWATASGAYANVGRRFDIGIFILRVTAGCMMLFAHGWGKLSNYGARLDTFGDPLGFGPAVTLTLAVFAEFFCSIAVALGLLTRLSVIPLIITMMTAAFIVHADDPFGKQEFPILYLLIFLTIFIVGPGKYSLDHFMLGGKK
jgi:putative oxidoreductase